MLKLTMDDCKILGSDDRHLKMVEKQMRLAHTNIAELETLIEQGTAMETW